MINQVNSLVSKDFDWKEFHEKNKYDQTKEIEGAKKLTERFNNTTLTPSTPELAWVIELKSKMVFYLPNLQEIELANSILDKISSSPSKDGFATSTVKKGVAAVLATIDGI